MVIDFHTHMFLDWLASKTIPLLAKRSGLTPFSDGTVGMALKKMKEQGVSKAVQLNIATNPKQMEKVNNFAIESNKLHEIIAFGSIHPLAENYVYELDRLQDAGIKGIKLHPDYQEFFIDSPSMQKVYEDILKRNFILIFHAGLDYGLPDPVHADVNRLVNTLSLFSGEKVVFAHMAGFQMYTESLEKIIGKDVYIDTSCSFNFAEKELIKTMILSHNPNKILFATDNPWGSFENEISMLQNLALDKELQDKILYKNAEQILNL